MLKQTGRRKELSRRLLTPLLLGGMLVGMANSALAANWVFDGTGVEYNISQVANGDTVLVKNGAILAIDVDKTLASLTLGDSAAPAGPGKVIFPPNNPPRTLTVTGNVVFSAGQANVFDMSTDPFAPNHLMRIKGSFLSGGQGTFLAGNGTVDYYNNGAQTITALQYKNLTLSTDGSTSGSQVGKTFSAGVTVAGVLTLKERAVGAAASPDGAVIYNVNASLVYNGSINQTTSKGEWKNSPGVMGAPVIINMANAGASVSLDADKSISALLTLTQGNLNDNGKTLSILGNVVNNTKHLGTGRILMAGPSGQSLGGNGSYGNITLGANNPLLKDGNEVGGFPKIAGRLIIPGPGKLDIEAFENPPGSGVWVQRNYGVSLLTYEGADQPVGTHGSTSSLASNQDNDVFVDTIVRKGMLTVLPKAAGVIVFTGGTQNQTITYGDPNLLHITGRIDPGTSGAGVNFAQYGNTAQPGEKVWVTITPPAPFGLIVSSALLGPGLTFDVTLDVKETPSNFRAYWPNFFPNLPPRRPADPGFVPPPYPIEVRYDSTTPLPPNLAGSTAPASLMINRMYIVIKPSIITKIYGDPDPLVQVCPNSSLSLPFVITQGELRNGDACIGSIMRTAGEDVGAYAFNLGDPSVGAFRLSLDYDLWFNPEGDVFTICQRPITVTPEPNQQKVYGTFATTPPVGGNVSDPPLLYTVSEPIIPGNPITGALTRVGANGYLPNPAGERVGFYPILLGDLSFGKNYKITFTPDVLFEITKLHITVSMNSNTKIYGEVDPANITQIKEIKITGSGAVLVPGPGLPFGDTTQGAPARDPGENVGIYAVKATAPGTWQLNPAIAGNYIVDYVNGQLEILKRPLIIAACCPVISYGDSIPTAYTYEPVSGSGNTARGLIRNGRSNLGPAPGSIPGQNDTIPAPTVNWSRTPVTCDPVNGMPGDYPFCLSGANDPNYAVQFVTGGPLCNDLGQPDTAYPAGCCKLKIVKAEMLVIAENKTKVADCYDCAPVTFTYKVQVKKNGQWINGFSCAQDTAANTFTPNGLISFQDNFLGNAVTATKPGVYEIRPFIIGSPPADPSPKYVISFVSGFLTITPQNLAGNNAPGNKTYSGNMTWGYDTPTCNIFGLIPPVSTPPLSFPPDQMVNLAWFAQKATGQAGVEPGWSLFTVDGNLNIIATPTCKFRLDLVTLDEQSTLPGRMSKFDPTRPQMWKIVQVNGAINVPGGLANLNNLVQINWKRQLPLPLPGPNDNFLFQNPKFEGEFDVSTDGSAIYLHFTPVGLVSRLAPFGPFPAWNSYLNNGQVGPDTDPTTLVGDTLAHDVDTLWLKASAADPLTAVKPQTPVTIDINVGNLNQPIIGGYLYIQFSSTFFDTSVGTINSPKVLAGGAPWSEVIFDQWNAVGELDTVIGIALPEIPTGTTANGTMAKVILTPTRTATGSSRVEFRADGGPFADGTGSLVTKLLGYDAGGSQIEILPARIMSDLITIANDSTAPRFANPEAKQVQPYKDSTSALPAEVNVLNGVANLGTVVRTWSGIPIPGTSLFHETTASGKVIIKFDVQDLPGVGLKFTPTLKLGHPASGTEIVSSTAVGAILRCTTPGTTDGRYTYEWNVTPNTPNGEWWVRAEATDMKNQLGTIGYSWFKMWVNTYQGTGVAELEQFQAKTKRVVTFKAADGLPGNDTKTWNPNLDFVSTPILDAGAYQDIQAFANRLKSPAMSDRISMWLRYGGVSDLPGMVARLRDMPLNIDAYINNLTYGHITDLCSLAKKLAYPTPGRIEEYVFLKLSDDTKLAVLAYAAPAVGCANWPQAQKDALEARLLDDLNKIVNGASIWDGPNPPVPGLNNAPRFTSVNISAETAWWFSPASNGQLMRLAQQNRHLLNDSMPEYIPGEFWPQFGAALTDYVIGPVTPALEAAVETWLIRCFDDLTVNLYFAQTPLHRQTMWPAATPPYDVCLYNEQVFVGVGLSATTRGYLIASSGAPVLSPVDLVKLNRNLLFDAYNTTSLGVIPLYEMAKLSVETVNSLLLGPTFDYDLMQIDLNKVIYGAPIPARLGVSVTPPAGASQARVNRLMLEKGYSTELSKSVLAPYVLQAMASSSAQVSAKTAWNLRDRLTGLAFTGVAGPGGIPVDMFDVNFVGDAVPNVPLTNFGANDHYLRGGDLTGDSVIDLWDFQKLRLNYAGKPSPPADQSIGDINGDLSASVLDYGLMKMNWSDSFAPEVQ